MGVELIQFPLIESLIETQPMHPAQHIQLGMGTETRYLIGLGAKL